MSDDDARGAPPEPDVERQRGLLAVSWVWIAPILAIALVSAVAYDRYTKRGPLIEVSFRDAEGMVAGQTRVLFRNVQVGLVEDLRIDIHRDQIVASLRMDADAAPYLDEDARFWVVRPRISGTTITGLSTLLTGGYVATSWNQDRGDVQDSFVGLEEPPLTPINAEGRRVMLRTESGQAIGPGAPVYFKRIPVGRIETRELGPDGAVHFAAFIDAPFDELITPDVRFWNVSGVSLDLSDGAPSIRVESIDALLAGGVAFDSIGFAGGLLGTLAGDMSTFELYSSRQEARESSFDDRGAPPLLVSTAFQGSVRGLRVGAPVEFRGVRVGELSDLIFNLGPRDASPEIIGVLELQPSRIGAPDLSPDEHLQRLQIAVEQGLRVQLATTNLLTGAVVVNLVERPDEPTVGINFTATPYPRLPSARSNADGIAQQAQNILEKIERFPLDEIGQATLRLIEDANKFVDDARGVVAEADGEGLSNVIDNANRALTSVDEAAGAIGEAAARLPSLLAQLQSSAAAAEQALDGVAPGSELYFELLSAVREAQDAAEAIESLAEAIERQPNAVLFGR